MATFLSTCSLIYVLDQVNIYVYEIMQSPIILKNNVKRSLLAIKAYLRVAGNLSLPRQSSKRAALLDLLRCFRSLDFGSAIFKIF